MPGKAWQNDSRILCICGTTKVGHVEAEQMGWLPEVNGWRSVKDMLAKEFGISIGRNKSSGDILYNMLVVIHIF